MITGLKSGLYLEEDFKKGVGMKIYIGSDHAGLELKKKVKDRFGNQCNFIDVGTFTEESCDYPDFGRLVAEKVLAENESKGIVICGTGIGISIAANRFIGIRCALCTSIELAEMSRLHNDSNILSLGARILDIDEASEIIETWLKTEFEGGRHQNRINKLDYSSDGNKKEKL